MYNYDKEWNYNNNWNYTKHRINIRLTIPQG